MTSVPLPNPFKRKRTALPSLLTDQVSCFAAAAASPAWPAAPAAVVAANNDNNNNKEQHLAKAFPPSFAKPFGAIIALSQMLAACCANVCTAKALNL
jgi:hypothetical protein